MKIAIPLCRNRIAPLFDVAESFLLVSSDDRREILSVPQTCTAEKCRILHENGVCVLLSGALSREWQKRMACLGIEIHSFLSGEAQEVLQIFQREGGLGLVHYAMPGCGLGACAQIRRRGRHRLCDFDQLIKE